MEENRQLFSLFFFFTFSKRAMSRTKRWSAFDTTRNPTKMEIVECLIPDVKDGKSSAEFRRINDMNRESSKTRALYYFHRSAYPGSVCRDTREIVVLKDSMRGILERVAASSYLNPHRKNEAKHCGTSSNQFFHDKKGKIPEPPKLAAPRGFDTTDPDEAFLRDARLAPYDFSSKARDLRSVYREDFCSEQRHRSTGKGYEMLPRRKVEDLVLEKEVQVSDGSKHDRLQALVHLSELSSVQRAANRRSDKKEEEADTEKISDLVATPSKPVSRPGDSTVLSERQRPHRPFTAGYRSVPRSHFLQK